ncbi:hypothetical protein EBN88_05445 [Streptomyces triticirhizae]|uniref:Uncharacterized protein n=1 Tax=Streptomyces triticirhizae TaxID=2483353 RepID=A0A3M2M4G1_9ACTN|nr:hypothetical protein EBN88_05445 [Streptomyces triticirhizae]
MKWPRRTCPVCARAIAIPGGQFARHDPEYRVPGWPLVSCTGSMRQAPPDAVQPVLFDTPAPTGDTPNIEQWALFPA